MGSKSWGPRLGALPHRRAAGKWRASPWCPLAAKPAAARDMMTAGMIKSSPQKIIAQGTDWRFLNALKRELKG
jgi:NitT/TauT family transport system substrate-binding protein